MSTAITNNNNISNVSPRASTPRASPRSAPLSSSGAMTQPILTTGSVTSEVTHLFRTQRVSEIRAFESRIRNEADDKSESLRHLLGTRYRDLLQAADRISDMCDGATNSVRNALQTVYQTSGNLRDSLNVRARGIGNSENKTIGDDGLKSPNASDADLIRRRSVHEVGSHLKYIVDSPEVLYACLEAGELYEAASRYIIAQRNYNAIVNNPAREGAVASKFAHARWKLVNAFKTQIIAAAERRLVTSGLDTKAYAHVFAAIVLLQAEKCDVVSLAEKLLSARTTWLVEVRHRYKDGDASVAMRDIAIVVRDTITCMSDLFWSEKDKTDIPTEKQDGSPSKEGVESLLRSVDDAGCQMVAQARERGGLNGTVIAWTSNVRAWLQDNGDALLASATTSRQVALALKAVDDTLSQKGWGGHCHAALQRPADFVFDIFTPFISARAGVVAEECVQVAVKRVLADINNAWDEVSGACDVGRGMWMAMSGQAINLGQYASSSSSSRDHFDPRLRSSGARHLDEERDVARMLVYNGAVASVVDTFESCLKEALSDVKTLSQRVTSVVASFDTAMGVHVPLVFDDLQKRVNEQVNAAEQLDEDQRDVAMEQCLFAARAAAALADTKCIADALKFIAFSASASKDGNNITRQQSTGLVELQVRAAAVSGLAYSIWARLLCDGIAPHVKEDLTWERRLVIEMGWIGATNEDDGDGNQKIQIDDDSSSMIQTTSNNNLDAAVRYPTTASTAVVNMLLRACKAASEAGGFALPVEAVEFIRDSLTNIIIHVYHKVLTIYTESSSNGDSNNNVDKALMQMLFDVQCLQVLLGDLSRSQPSPSSSSSLKQLESEIQARIDPIDLASCRKALRESVANYVARTSILFGPVARRRDGRTPWAGVIRGSTYTSTTVANLVSLAPPVQRFTYLPAPMPSSYNSAGSVGIHAKAVVGALRSEAAAASAAANVTGSGNRKRESMDSSVAGYASKVSESVGRFGRGFFESLTRKVA